MSGEPLPGPFDPGKKSPGGGGSGQSIPPVVIIWPSGGGDETLPSGHKGEGVPVKAPEGTESCEPCGWLKANYDQTGLTRWLDQYRLCLTWVRAS